MSKLNWILLLAINCIMVSCSNSDQIETPEDSTIENELSVDALEDFAYEAIYRMQETGSIGRFGCFELVFPINIEFPDESNLEVNSYDELVSALMSWRESNTETRIKPSFTFPIEVLNEDGEIISVQNKRELIALKISCGRPFGGGHSHFDRPQGGNNGSHGCSCFEIQYPVTIEFPDGSFEDAVDRRELKQFIRSWRINNPDSEDRPILSYPLEVVLEDGSEMTLNNQTELRRLKRSCE